MVDAGAEVTLRTLVTVLPRESVARTPRVQESKEETEKLTTLPARDAPGRVVTEDRSAQVIVPVPPTLLRVIVEL